ncbi:hypothetical protein [Candidatus Absconditicoccus praedator]|uniref:hypothetical protein n=1 Tax=Candidatus Absconditicoccus praedator TaxID=2735562 RepID=UPI001E524B94|nr:hypothetical protein [Candidatus Absconditicoccus praedator]UFX83400.1 hypothetical protein HLG78_04700 [Candidatus Absconditicoccus praedator]
MSYITNKELVENHFSKADDRKFILDLFLVVLYLYKKYGKNLLTNRFQSVLKDVDESIVDLIVFLNTYGKLNKEDLLNLLSLFKQQNKDLKGQFDVFINSKKIDDSIKKTICEKFGECDVDSYNQESVGMFAKGEGYYFKRTLDSDLSRLLR